MRSAGLNVILLLLLLSGCMFVPVHRMKIEQGNVITPEMAARIHPGMSEGAVKNIMGEPVLMSTFSNNRLNYVYTLKTPQNEKIEKYLTLTFRNGQLQTISNNIYR